MTDLSVPSAACCLPRLNVKNYWAPFALMVLIFILSSIPGKTDNRALRILVELQPQWQNLLHIPLFGLLQFLWLRSFDREGRSALKTFVVCGAISVSYGVVDECHQLLVPGRYASLLDMGLNLLGIVLATLAFILWDRPAQGAIR